VGQYDISYTHDPGVKSWFSNHKNDTSWILWPIQRNASTFSLSDALITLGIGYSLDTTRTVTPRLGPPSPPMGVAGRNDRLPRFRLVQSLTLALRRRTARPTSDSSGRFPAQSSAS
jgi:hypothetical protein